MTLEGVKRVGHRHDPTVLVADWTTSAGARAASRRLLEQFSSSEEIACRYVAPSDVERYAKQLMRRVGDLAQWALCGPHMMRNLMALQANMLPILFVNSGCDLVPRKSVGHTFKDVTYSDGRDPSEWAFVSSSVPGAALEVDLLDEAANILKTHSASQVSFGYSGEIGFSSGYHALYRSSHVALGAVADPIGMLRGCAGLTLVERGYVPPGPILIDSCRKMVPFISPDQSDVMGGADARGLLVTKSAIAPMSMSQPVKTKLAGFGRRLTTYDLVAGIKGVNSDALLSLSKLGDDDFTMAIHGMTHKVLNAERDRLAAAQNFSSTEQRLADAVSEAISSVCIMIGEDPIDDDERKRLRQLAEMTGKLLAGWKTLVEVSTTMRDKGIPPMAKV